MKILITGAGGQLGRSLPAALFRHVVTTLPHKELDITRLNQ
ncbi:MAG: dTDP-4-dehydrorhamnose reductase, partial [Blastocatellia bacterium AA13]